MADTATKIKIQPLGDRIIVKVSEPKEIKTGDTVLYGKYSGTEIKINDEEYLIMNEADVLGIVK